MPVRLDHSVLCLAHGDIHAEWETDPYDYDYEVYSTHERYEWNGNHYAKIVERTRDCECTPEKADPECEAHCDPTDHRPLYWNPRQGDDPTTEY